MSEGRHPGHESGARPLTPPAEVPQYSYGWLLPIAGALMALIIAFAVYKLHYTYGQAPHRIIKMLIGGILVLAAVLKPRLALHAWLLAMPIGEWLPASGIPGVNGPNLLFLVILGSWIVPRVMHGGAPAVRTELTKPIAFFIAVLFLSYIRSITFPASGAEFNSVAMLKAVWQSLIGFAIYFVAVNTVKDERQIRSLLITMSVGCSIGALIALQQFVTAVGERRIGGALGDVNDLGAYFAIVASFLIGAFYAAGGMGFVKRAVLFAGAALSSVAVFLPKSRGAFLGFGLSVGLLTALASKRAFVIFLIVLAASPLWAPGFVKERVAETTMDTLEAGIYGDPTDRLDPSAAVRLEIWAIVIRESLKSPVIGYGYGSIPYLTMQHLDRPWSAHSLYVEVLGESGLIGLGVLAWLFIVCLRSGRRLLRVSTDRFGRGVAIGFLSATVALMASNLFGQRLSHMSIAGTYFYAAALVDRLTIIRRDRLPAPAGKGA